MGAPTAHPAGGGMLSLPIRDLVTGDVLISLSGPANGQLAPDRPAVVGSVAYDEDVADGPCEIRTSAGTLTAPATTTAAVDRMLQPAPGRPLLVSRRHSLHETLCLLGTPIARRTPAAVHPDEYAQASVVIIDGYLARMTLVAMLDRGVLPRPATLVVGTDPDDARIWRRAAAVDAHGVSFLPDHADFVQTVIARAVVA
jgi:hypothetical protein